MLDCRIVKKIIDSDEMPDLQPDTVTAGRRRFRRVIWMELYLLAGLGGFLGAMLRFGVGGLINRVKQGASFPYETLIINVAACLAIGFLATLSDARGVIGGGTRVFLFIGFLGGFSTFSTFGYESLQLIRDGQMLALASSVVLQVVLGIGAVWAGAALTQLLPGR
jgi:CrcB protein